MTNYVNKAGLSVSQHLVHFIEEQVLPGTALDSSRFWTGVAEIYGAFTTENIALLKKRDTLQTTIDDWHKARAAEPIDQGAYQKFLQEIGYLAPEPKPFKINVSNVDNELALTAGPQLVVPVLNARFLLNATNARWGSLYDALYGTDVIPGDKDNRQERNAQVITWSKNFLDRAVPLSVGSHQDVEAYCVKNGHLVPTLADPSQFAGYGGAPESPCAVLFRHNGLHIELTIDRTHPVGKDDPAGISDILLEAALTTIVDFEDSVAAVDAEDKITGYGNWLGLMQGDLHAKFEKNGKAVTRHLETDRPYFKPNGSAFTLPGRSLLFARNVGHHMMTPALLLADGSDAPEGILDGIVTSLIATHNLKQQGNFINSHRGSIYIVKPKMHGPDEVAFTNRLFNAIEDFLGLSRHTIKIGVMDEERRTSANLAACIHAVKDRIMFINTGFLDRTGDEIHTSMKAGPMIRKGDMKKTKWLQAYEDRNVLIGLACGFSKKAQIGKGMWAMPDQMKDMVEQKIGHPQAGASAAWVPSPTAATLHAVHYHDVDVFAQQKEREAEPTPSLTELLTIPINESSNWTEAEICEELENNTQSILGYVVRWIDQGIGCSKVPDIHDIGLMEDRATLRIASQLLANWLLHGVCTSADIDDALSRMAAKVDVQNQNDPAYEAMAGNETTNLAFQTARALIFKGDSQPNGYTEPLLHHFRMSKKQAVRMS